MLIQILFYPFNFIIGIFMKFKSTSHFWGVFLKCKHVQSITIVQHSSYIKRFCILQTSLRDLATRTRSIESNELANLTTALVRFVLDQVSQWVIPLTCKS